MFYDEFFCPSSFVKKLCKLLFFELFLNWVIYFVGSVNANSFNGSFNGDGTKLNILSNNIIQTILSNISALFRLCGSVTSSPAAAAPTTAPTSPSSASVLGIKLSLIS